MKYTLTWVRLLEHFGSRPATAWQSCTPKQVLSTPFLADLLASKTGNHMAWAFAQEGRGDMWVAEKSFFATRQSGGYQQDDGEGPSGLPLTADVVRLPARGVLLEVLRFPLAPYDFLLHRNWCKAYQANCYSCDSHLAAPQE
jgi:hypothetical protein